MQPASRPGRARLGRGAPPLGLLPLCYTAARRAPVRPTCLGSRGREFKYRRPDLSSGLCRSSRCCRVVRLRNQPGGSTMRRLMLSFVFMVGIAMAGAPAASAGGNDGPVTVPVPDFSGTLVGYCGFPVHFRSVVNREHITYYPDGRTVTRGKLTVALRNTRPEAPRDRYLRPGLHVPSTTRSHADRLGGAIRGVPDRPRVWARTPDLLAGHPRRDPNHRPARRLATPQLSRGSHRQPLPPTVLSTAPEYIVGRSPERIVRPARSS